jgi:hypothetical protein
VAAITWADVTAVAPELTSTPAAAQTLFLSIVNGDGLSVSNFGGEEADLLKAARIFLAAHLGTVLKRRGAGGGIASQTEGGASQSYWYGFANPSVWDTTSYGQMLRTLTMGTPARAGFLVGGGGWGC